MSNSVRVCVIGAGVSGLCAAVQVQEMLERRGMKGEVVVMADKFNRETTSDGAAGMFNPRVNVTKSVPEELCPQWFRDSFEYFYSLATSEVAPEAGVQFVSGYEFYKNDPYDVDPMYKELYIDIRDCNEKELKLFGLEGTTTRGIFYTTLMVEGRWFLPWMMKRFKDNGGKVVQKKVESLKELAGNFDIAVNCSGLGSNELLHKQETIPIRGQLIRVKASWIKHFLVVDGYNLYIMPGKETVVIGGTYQIGDDEEEVRKEDTERMWKVACEHMPCIQRAEWQWQWVGLRPHREVVRLEREDMVFDGRPLPVVHNYGHGGNGIALSWGTGKHVCRLVEEVIGSRSKL